MLASFPSTRADGLRSFTAKTIGNRTLRLCLAGGLIFIAAFYWRYWGIDNGLYHARDDGVITMSHAKNWIEYGFIGVNPSGDRVEGYSTPVQFFIYALAYAATGIGYNLFAHIQTVVCTFMLGAVFILFFRQNWGYAIISTSLSAIVLSYYTPFLLWHGSGMENAITHVLFLATIFILFHFASTGRITYGWSVVVFLAATSRTDGIYYVAPLLVVFSIYSLAVSKTPRGVYFSLIVLGMWTALNLWRYTYFGDLYPNTAYAQNIALGARFDILASSGREYIQEIISQSNQIFLKHGGYLLLATWCLILLPFVFKCRVGGRMLFLMLGTVALTTYIAPFVFGPARLDFLRTATHLAVATVLAIAMAPYLTLDTKRYFLRGAPILLTVGAAVVWMTYAEPYALCCSSIGFNPFREKFDQIAREESLPRPTVANADLGLVSYHKQFNIVDLGYLGSTAMAKLKSSPELVNEYLFDLIAPDIIEIHAVFSCLIHPHLFSDPRLEANYMPHEIRASPYIEEHCPDAGVQSGYWVRRDVLESSDSRERALIDDLQNELRPERLAEELEACQSNTPDQCVYVARTAYRFLPEFRQRGHIEELNRIFLSSRTKKFDLYLINGYRDGQLHQDAVTFVLERYVDKAKQGGRLIIESNYDVYLTDRELVYVNDSCDDEDASTRFFLHITPAETKDLPDERKQHAFDNLDFDFRHRENVDFRGTCVAKRELPDYEIQIIDTGQYTPEGRTWTGNWKK